MLLRQQRFQAQPVFVALVEFIPVGPVFEIGQQIDERQIAAVHYVHRLQHTARHREHIRSVVRVVFLQKLKLLRVDGRNDGLTDGETEYVIKIPVRERPEPSDIEPTPEQQDTITEAIAALNVAVTQTAQDVISADASATAAAQSATGAQTAALSAQGSATAASASATIATDAAGTATTKASEAATSAEYAAQSATNANRDADRAEQAAATSGYLWFYIEEGKLYLDRTPNTQVDFYMQDGKLYVEEIA